MTPEEQQSLPSAEVLYMSFCHFSLGLAVLGKGNGLAIQCKNLSVICDGNKCRKSVGRGERLNHIPLAPCSPGTHYLSNIYESLYIVYIRVMPRSSSSGQGPPLCEVLCTGSSVCSDSRDTEPLQKARAITERDV